MTYRVPDVNCTWYTLCTLSLIFTILNIHSTSFICSRYLWFCSLHAFIFSRDFCPAGFRLEQIIRLDSREVGSKQSGWSPTNISAIYFMSTIKYAVISAVSTKAMIKNKFDSWFLIIRYSERIPDSQHLHNTSAWPQSSPQYVHNILSWQGRTFFSTRELRLGAFDKLNMSSLDTCKIIQYDIIQFEIIQIEIIQN